MRVELLYFDDCPNWRVTDGLLATLSEELGFTVERREVHSLEEAEELDFRGSPTVRIDGADPFADPSGSVGMSCRIYATPEGLAGSPTLDQLRAALVGTRGA